MGQKESAFLIALLKDKNYDALLDYIFNDNSKLFKLDISVFVETGDNSEKKVVLRNIADKYDDQTIEDWYDFAGTVEGIVDRKFKIRDILLSQRIDSLSEYMTFYLKDGDDNKPDGLIHLRLSDYELTNHARKTRKRKVRPIDIHNRLISIIVNDKKFDTYTSAFNYIEKVLQEI